jgi:hypothetical protein
MPLATNRADATTMATTHAADHNAVNAAINAMPLDAKIVKAGYFIDNLFIGSILTTALLDNANEPRIYPMIIGRAVTFDQVSLALNSVTGSVGGTTMNCKSGVYDSDPATGHPRDLLASVTFSWTAIDTWSDQAISLSLPVGLYWLASMTSWTSPVTGLKLTAVPKGDVPRMSALTKPSAATSQSVTNGYGWSGTTYAGGLPSSLAATTLSARADNSPYYVFRVA